MFRRSRLLIAICLITLAAFRSAEAQTSAGESEKAVRELLDLTGAGSLGVQIVQQLVANFQKAMPNVPATFWNEFMKEVDPTAMVNLVVPIYMKHFTRDEINGMIAFYKTPLGRKLVHELPAISQESMAAGQRWGGQLGQRIAERLKAKGYK